MFLVFPNYEIMDKYDNFKLKLHIGKKQQKNLVYYDGEGLEHTAFV